MTALINSDTWKVIRTTDEQHIGERIESVVVGETIVFNDGDRVFVENIIIDDDGKLIAFNSNYQITLVKE